MLSVVIPALNAAETLERSIRSVAGAKPVSEIIVADGGSTDGTPRRAQALGARVIHAERGRGPQLRAGAEAAHDRWLLFLHADTALGTGWVGVVRRFIADPGNARRAAAFRFALDDSSLAARRLERMVAWRGRATGLVYGDQGLLIARAFYRETGGFQPWPLFEDVDMVRRIGRDRLTVFPVAAVTSAARYRRGGYLLRPAKNLACLGLYFAHVPPRWIAKLYG